MLEKAWYNIPDYLGKKHSLLKRVQDVLSLKGGHSKYKFLPVEGNRGSVNPENNAGTPFIRECVTQGWKND